MSQGSKHVRHENGPYKTIVNGRVVKKSAQKDVYDTIGRAERRAAEKKAERERIAKLIEQQRQKEGR